MTIHQRELTKVP